MLSNTDKNKQPVIYLLPAPLDESAIQAIHPDTIEAVKDCTVFFVENERTARRFLKRLWKEIVIDGYEWFTIHKAEEEVIAVFRQKIKEGKNIGIISEAGCPGIADPGQLLVAVAQEMNVPVKPLVGPSSILLALMASGMNGQHFQFWGYLPVNNNERIKLVRELETESAKRNCTQIFIETPYRNNQLIEAILQVCKPGTKLCIAVDITGEKEWIRTKSIKEWKQNKPDIHKRPAIFCIYAGH